MLPDLLKQDQRIDTILDLASFLKTQPEAVLSLFSDVVKLIRLILTVPETSATSERSFSELRRLKTWTRSTMTQKRLTHLAIAHCHQDKLDSLDISMLCNAFASKTREREKTFRC